MKFEGLNPVLELDLTNLSKTVELVTIEGISYKHPILKITFSKVIPVVIIALILILLFIK